MWGKWQKKKLLLEFVMMIQYIGRVLHNDNKKQEEKFGVVCEKRNIN